MWIDRTPNLEFDSGEAWKQAEISYDTIRDATFPTLELVVNIKTGPTSVVSILLDPNKSRRKAVCQHGKKLKKL